MLTSDRFTQDQILVENETGTRGPDGLQATGTETILQSSGDAQKVAQNASEAPAVYDLGGLRFYATESVADVRPGHDATVTLQEGREIEATVEGVELDANAILLSQESAI